MFKCEFADERAPGKKDKNANRWCARKECYCNGNGNLFEDGIDADHLEILDPKDICKNTSIFGNYYFKIGAVELRALMDGKCLALTGEEYNTFIVLEGMYE